MELLEVQKEADSAGRKAIIFGIGALMLAGVFGWMLARLGGGGPEIESVVVAAEEIPPLTQLKAKHLRLVQWPKTSKPQGTFAKIEDVVTSDQLNLAGMVAGEPVIQSRLSTPERGLGVSQLVEPSMRAYVVQVNDSIAKSKIIHPGALVDVIATLDDQRSREQVSKVILQNVQVLAVGDSVDLEPRPTNKDDASHAEDRSQVERHRVVTLLVNLSDVEYLAFASTQGKIDLALRSNVDAEIVPTTGVNMEKLMGTAHPTNNNEAKPAPQVVDSRPSTSKSHTSRSRSAPPGPSIYKIQSSRGR